jgi:hypothetical protein
MAGQKNIQSRQEVSRETLPESTAAIPGVSKLAPQPMFHVKHRRLLATQ